MRRSRSSPGIMEAVASLAVALTLLSSTSLCAQTPPPPPIMLGTAWYPEQWPESRWDADLTLMQQAGIHMVRVGEFAWSRMEPSEGHYDLDWLDRAVSAASKHGIYTVVGTPTAAPPAWLTQKYPETLRMDEDGHRAEHGNRQQFNFANPKYRELARKIAEQLAMRFGHNPYVLGWQIDNEYCGRLVRSRYESAVSTVAQGALRHSRQSERALDYFLLERNDFRLEPDSHPDASMAIPACCWPGSDSSAIPGAVIRRTNWKSFAPTPIPNSSSPRTQWDGMTASITTSSRKISTSPPGTTTSGQGHLDPAKNGFAHDLTRGFKRKNFWVMETQPGSVNWAPVNNCPR